jgi:hypothetical protein
VNRLTAEQPRRGSPPGRSSACPNRGPRRENADLVGVAPFFVTTSLGRIAKFLHSAKVGSFAGVRQTELPANEMRTLRSELDERLEDFAETVGERIDSVREETRGLVRDELQSEIAELRRGLRLLIVAVVLAVVGVLAMLLVQLL